MEIEESENRISSENAINYEDIDDLDNPELFLETDILQTDRTEDDPEGGTKEHLSGDPDSTQKLRLPVSKIKHIMKLDPEAAKITLEALVMTTKATEMFLDALAKEAFTHTAAAKKKTLQKNDVETAINTVDALFFLEGCFKSS
ncbi:DNA polymerase epsilon subunit 4-like [Sergentomyia squamirostris]